jgi:hypothetical protein
MDILKFFGVFQDTKNAICNNSLRQNSKSPDHLNCIENKMKKIKKEKCSNLLKNEFWVFPPEYSVLLFTIIALCREQQEENSTAVEF